jgi:hypothetical protein
MIFIHPNPKNDVIYHSLLGFQCKRTMFIVATVILPHVGLFYFLHTSIVMMPDNVSNQLSL